MKLTSPMTRRSFTSFFGRAAAITTGSLIVPSFAHSAEDGSEMLFTCTDFTASGGFTSGVEGPACDKDGNLYAVNFAKQGTIGRVTPDSVAEIFVTLPAGSIGNGIRFDSRDTMLIADYTAHNILAVDMTTKEITVFAHESAMNQPNDIAITTGDVIFASDPNWSKGTGNVWRIDQTGSVTKVETLDVITNGIEVSPDETKLYVNTSSGSPTVFVYDLDANGTASNRRIFVLMPGSGADGMRCDIDGNLYVTRPGQGAVTIFSPDGTLLHTVSTKGTRPSNIAFGGTDGRTCYLTMADRGNIEMFRTDTPGRSWKIFRDRNPLAVEDSNPIPAPFSITGNTPNPFNAATTIEYSLVSGMNVEIAVFNTLGQKIEVLDKGFHQAGRYTVRWNGNTSPSGVYFCVMSGNGARVSRKMMLLK